MKKMYKTAAVVAASALVLFTGCKSDHKEETAEEVMEVTVATPDVDSVILYKTYPGYIAADKTVDLMARVDGYLKSVNYSGGDYVHAGQVLYEIDASTYADALKEAQSRLATAKAELEYNRSHAAAVERAFATEAVSRDELLQAKSTLESSEAAVRQAQAAVATATTQLGYCTVRAPFDGHMTSNALSVGSFLNGSASPVRLGTIYDDAYMIAHFAIEDSRYITMLNDSIMKQRIDFTHMPIHFSDNLPHSYQCNLTYMAPNVDLSTGTMNLEAHVKNEYGELKDGMFASVDLPYGFEPQAILINSSAIGSDQLGSYVYVVNDENKVVYTPVEVGQTVGTRRIITKGLKAGDRYVTEAIQKVRDGMTVKPKTE